MHAVLLGQRIEARAKKLGMSQSQLARRAGVPQSTINTLINGDARWTPHMLKIARALQTSPSYLAAETDDPEAEAAPAPDLDGDSRTLVDAFEQLTQADRGAVLRHALSLAGKLPPPGGSVHSPRQKFKPRVDNVVGDKNDAD